MGRPATKNMRIVKAAWYRPSLTAAIVAELVNSSADYINVLWGRLKAAGELPKMTRAQWFKDNPDGGAPVEAADAPVEAADDGEWGEIGCAIPAGDPLLAALKASPEGQSELRRHDDMTAALARAGKKEKA